MVAAACCLLQAPIAPLLLHVQWLRCVSPTLPVPKWTLLLALPSLNVTSLQ